MRLLSSRGVARVTLTRVSQTQNYVRYEKPKLLGQEVREPFGYFYLPLDQAQGVDTVTVIVNKNDD